MTNPLKLATASSHGRPGVVASAAYAAGSRVAEIPIEEAGEWSRKPGHVVWIGLHEPDLELLRQLQREFNLHELAIEDALKAHQRPKLEQYGDALFVVARTAQMFDGRIAFGETHLFVGKGYVVSVRHGASTSYRPVRERCEAAQKAFSEGEDFILYAILDFIVDNYIPVIQTIQDGGGGDRGQHPGRTASQLQVTRLYQLRRDLLRLRNAAIPLVEVCRRLEQPGLPGSILSMSPALPRRLRPYPPGAGGDRVPARGAGLRLRDQPDDRTGAADRDHAQARILGRHPGRAHRRRRTLRHEFRRACPSSIGNTATPSFSW